MCRLWQKERADSTGGEISMPKNILIAVDPGKLSGFVVLDIEQTLVDGSTPVILDSSEREQMETCFTVHELLSKRDSDTVVRVVCENFLITTQTGKKKDTHYSLEIIGTIRYLCGLHGVPFALQKPADGKSFSTDERLKSMGLYVSGGHGHARDAMRHAVYFLAFYLDLTPKGLLIT